MKCNLSFESLGLRVVLGLKETRVRSDTRRLDALQTLPVGYDCNSRKVLLEWARLLRTVSVKDMTGHTQHVMNLMKNDMHAECVGFNEEVQGACDLPVWCCLSYSGLSTEF